MLRPVDRLLDALVYMLAVVVAIASAAAIMSDLHLELGSWWAKVLLGTVLAAPLARGLQRWRRDERRRVERLDRLVFRRVVAHVDPADDLHVVPRARLHSGNARYVSRLLDPLLRARVREKPFVLVIGKSKAGKSRTAYEAARAVLGSHVLLMPREVRRDTLEQVFQLLRPWDHWGRSVVLWLDELDRYVTARALPVHLLESWRQRPGSVVVLATMGEKPYHRLVHPSAGLARSPKQAVGVLAWAEKVVLPDRLEGAEVEQARRLYPGHDWTRISLGAVLAHGPQLIDRYRTAAEASPDGVACVSAAIDWRRAGMTRPIRRSELRDLYRWYLARLAPRQPGSAGGFESGLKWALEPLRGSDVRLLYPLRMDDGGEPAYESDDYVLADRDGQGEPAAWQEPVPDEVFEAIVAFPTVTPNEALQVAFTARLRGALATALHVYEALARRGPIPQDPDSDEVTAWALCGRAAVLGDLDRRSDAIAACDEVVERFGESQVATIQRPVAWSLLDRGALLSELGRQREEIAAYEEVERRFGDSSDAALRGQVAVALYNRGVALAHLGEPELAIALYDGVVGRYGEAGQPALGEQVALALYRKGLTLEQIDRLEDAIAVYDAVLARLSEPSPPGLAALALYRKGIVLGRLDRAPEAILVYDEIIGRFGHDSGADLLEPVAWAMYNKAVRLGGMGRTQDELSLYDQVVGRFGGADQPRLQEPAAWALVNKGGTLGRLRRNRQELAVYDEVERRFGAASDPALREALAVALYNRAVALGRLERPQEAAVAYEEVVRRFGGGTERALQTTVALARFNREITLKHMRPAAGRRSTWP